MLRDTDIDRDGLLLGSAEVVGAYVVSYGAAGYFERFLPANGEHFERGDRVFIKSRRGIEAGVVLCPATRGLDEFFHDQPTGELLRRVGLEDEGQLLELHDASLRAFDRARALCQQLELTIEVVDVEALLEPRTFLFHHLGGPGDYRELVSRLSKEFDVYVELISLSGTLPAAEKEGEVCAECGSTEGGCSTSGGGGCGTDAGCGTAKKQMTPDEWRAYFASLRQQMNGRSQP
jgi:hypothetical protein